jgi:origin recognition complex subunit 1
LDFLFRFFKNACKINEKNGKRPTARQLLNQTAISMCTDDSISVKSVNVKRAIKKIEQKQKTADVDFEISSTLKSSSSNDDYDSDSSFSDESINITTTKLKKTTLIKKISQTPKAVKRTLIVRRNTISSATMSPSLQKRLNSKVDAHSSLSVYEKARIKLHVANTPDCLPCRDKQFSDIYTFIESNLKNQTGGCLYVCGVPGTGKTLTTRQVVICLKEQVADKVLPRFKFIDVNAFQVTEPHQIYKLIYKELTGENVSAEHAVMLLEKKFEQKSSESIVLLVDELDMLCTKKQDVLYNLFDWPYKKNSKWIVIAIANAMNLPEQVMMNKISSRLGLTRMTFQPYTHNELEEIVRLRCEELNIFEEDAIMFASRKVSSVSGDARRALEICRRATEIAENEFKELKLVSIFISLGEILLINLCFVFKVLRKVNKIQRIITI